MVRDDLTLEELRDLPSGSVVLDCDSDAWQKDADQWFAYSEDPIYSEELFVWRPIAVIWEGEDG